uniref:Uncharacterized protein n=1 Tax=Anopheles atroparvus TaxID=41427 RepID=A0AAG5DS57_ANOAO
FVVNKIFVNKTCLKTYFGDEFNTEKWSTGLPIRRLHFSRHFREFCVKMARGNGHHEDINRLSNRRLTAQKAGYRCKAYKCWCAIFFRTPL